MHIWSLFQDLNLCSHHNIAPRVIFDQYHSLFSWSENIADYLTAQESGPICVFYLVLAKFFSSVFFLNLVHGNRRIFYQLLRLQLKLMDKSLAVERLLKLEDLVKFLVDQVLCIITFILLKFWTFFKTHVNNHFLLNSHQNLFLEVFFAHLNFNLFLLFFIIIVGRVKILKKFIFGVSYLFFVWFLHNSSF